MSESTPYEEPDYENQECHFCGTPYHEHVKQEKSGDVRHRWSKHGGPLTVVETNTPSNRVEPGTTPVIIAPAPDILLRQLLRDKGVISDEEYKAL